MMSSGSAFQTKGLGLSELYFANEAVGFLEIDHRVEDAVFEPASGEFGEEPLGGIGPGA